jgi:dihydrofolate reductase
LFPALLGESIKHDLLDELIVSVHPLVLGNGVPLFPQGLPKKQFQLIKAEPFDTGLVQLTYRRTR